MMKLEVAEIVALLTVFGSLITAISIYLKNRKENKRSDLEMVMKVKDEMILQLRQEVMELESRLDNANDGTNTLKMNKIATDLAKAISEAQSNLVEALYELNAIKLKNATLTEENERLKSYNGIVESQFKKLGQDLEKCSANVKYLVHYVKNAYDDPTCSECITDKEMLRIIKEQSKLS